MALGLLQLNNRRFIGSFVSTLYQPWRNTGPKVSAPNKAELAELGVAIDPNPTSDNLVLTLVRWWETTSPEVRDGFLFVIIPGTNNSELEIIRPSGIRE